MELRNATRQVIALVDREVGMSAEDRGRAMRYFTDESEYDGRDGFFEHTFYATNLFRVGNLFGKERPPTRVEVKLKRHHREWYVFGYTYDDEAAQEKMNLLNKLLKQYTVDKA